MSLTPGARIGGYEIVEFLGAGGMGEVWRARDHRLGRDVALKILPAALSADPDRLNRLEREARLLASLSHPNIATLYGVEEFQGGVALVMELVEGGTLAGRTVRTAEALEIAAQIAAALDAAHEKGIVHRDLKPANIKIAPDGVVKVLDFGLAKSTALSDPSVDVTSAPTGAALGTEAGVILGTVAYMSPEQARGLAVDKRTDIWAFGCVLYEMLTGRQAFAGPTMSDVLAGVLERQPDWRTLPTDTPAHLRRLLQRCLEKDLRKRLRDIGDARTELEEATISPPAPSAPIAAADTSSRRAFRPWIAGTAAVAALAVIVAWVSGSLSRTAPAAASVRVSAVFVESPRSGPYGLRHLAISDDGAQIAYSSRNRLWIRRLDQRDPIAIGPGGSGPFFSPDGAWVGYVDETRLAKVPVGGGSPVTIAETTSRPAGAAWRADGTIVFATNEGLFEVAEQGGAPRLLAKPDRTRGERLYAWPDALPGSDAVLFTILTDNRADGAQLAALDLKTLKQTPVMKNAASARYLPTGQLVFVSGSTLKTVRFNPTSLRSQDEPAPLPGLDIAVAADNDAADFAIAPSGTLIYLPSSVASTASLQSTLYALSWIDRTGKRERIGIAPGTFQYPRVSPDGKRVALDVPANNRDIWILDLNRLSLTQLTNGPTEDMMPEWSRDGSRIYFASDRTGNFDIYSQAADGATGPKLEFAGPGFQAPLSITPDGTRMVVVDLFRDLKLLWLGRPDRLEPLLADPAIDHRNALVSGSGQWLVYESDESGKQYEVFVRPFPNVNAGREKISIDGGRYARWDPKGNQIFYVSLDGDMMAVPYTTSPSFKAGQPSKLFTWRKPPPGRSAMTYDISPVDGRFIVVDPVDAQSDRPVEVSIILNWLPELSRRLSGRN